LTKITYTEEEGELESIELPEFKSEDEMTDDELDNEVFLEDDDDLQDQNQQTE
jgi:hypothetical protein